MKRGHAPSAKTPGAGKGTAGAAAGAGARDHGVAGLQRVHGNRFVARALTVQRKSEGAGEPGLTPGLSSYLASPGPGQRIAQGPSDVRVHNDSRAHSAAASLKAKAMTVGKNIFFSAGRFQPGTGAGAQLLSHELAHVEQQRGGRVGTGLVDDPGLEKDADDAAAGRRRPVRSLGRTGVQRQSEPKKDENKDQKKDEKKDDTTPATPNPGAGPMLPGLSKLDLLPPYLRPQLPPAETPSERLSRMLQEDAAAADRAKGITHRQNSAGPSAAPAPAAPAAGVAGAKPPENQDLVSAARALLARCDRDQKAKGDPQRRVDPSSDRSPKDPPDVGKEISAGLAACLETPEGENFTTQAKAFLFSAQGAPVTLGAVSGLLSYFAQTGRIAYIPAIPLGDNAELSLSVKGPVNKPDQAMLTLSIRNLSGFGSQVGRGLSRVGHGIAWLGGKIWQGLRAAGRGIAWLGAKIGQGLSVVGDAVWTGVSWLARKVWDTLSGALGRVVEWMLKLPVRIARLLKTLIEGVAALRPWSLKFWQSLGQAATWTDFLKWLGTVGLELAEIAGIGEIYETAAEIAKVNTRTLQDSEREAGQQVFGNTISWRLVRVDERAALGPSWTGREYTSFHTINGWGPITLPTMIHELTHVWQYETAGAIYMPQAIHAQAGAGYNYGDLAGLQAAKTSGQGILTFNREQQAQIVEDFYLLASGGSAMMSGGTRADLPLYAHFVKEVSSHQEAHLAQLRV